MIIKVYKLFHSQTANHYLSEQWVPNNDPMTRGTISVKQLYDINDK